MIVVAGSVGSDPQVTHLDSGKVVAKFSVADRLVYSKDGAANWRSCELWGKIAETAEAYVKKGSKVVVVGELAEETYTNKEGVEVTKYIIKANKLALMDSKPQSGEAESAVEQKAASRPASGGAKTKVENSDFSDIPF